MASQTLHVVPRIEQPWVVENHEIGFACNLWDFVDQVVRVPADAREVILDVPSVNADSQECTFLTDVCRALAGISGARVTALHGTFANARHGDITDL